MTKTDELIKEYEKIDEEEINKPDYSCLTNNNITQYKSDLGFKTLVQGLDQGLYVIPKYQRKFIWLKQQVEELAVSLIRGLPIPPIYVCRNEKKQMEILDGQQRMISLFLYYKGKYIKNSTNTSIELQEITSNYLDNEDNIDFLELIEKLWKLKSVKYNYKYIDDNSQEEKSIDISYDKLPIEIKRTVDFTTISIIEIKVDDEKNKNRILYKVFENLNSGGTQLTKQELRNGIYQCKFYDMLHEINNTNEKWRRIYGTKHKHSRDVELLLRFAAVEYFFKVNKDQIEIEQYVGSYPKLLNDFSDKAINFDDDTILKFKNNIENFIDKIEVEGKIPALLIESLYLASTYIEGNYVINNIICDQILNSKEFEEVTKNSSASTKNVKDRFNYVYKELSKYVNGNTK
ncbi:DUF262 domain-containing protein [Clostridium botulinum]|uniref:DUF262 domain-containing protein n=1 Tax=Clostridium TaxID=1485 RepID=UPI0013FCBF88|nr:MULTISPECIES: DUF262 domain-containing protein [Clostridium]MBN1065546.1 DUF262 domain-containing protein [Clostridium botulinum]NFF82636.1 DUF262 domain-containing protein [Clostridium botulinum]